MTKDERQQRAGTADAKVASDCDGRYVPHRCQYCQWWTICGKVG